MNTGSSRSARCCRSPLRLTTSIVLDGEIRTSGRHVRSATRSSRPRSSVFSTKTSRCMAPKVVRRLLGSKVVRVRSQFSDIGIRAKCDRIGGRVLLGAASQPLGQGSAAECGWHQESSAGTAPRPGRVAIGQGRPRGSGRRLCQRTLSWRATKVCHDASRIRPYAPRNPRGAMIHERSN